MPEPVHVEVFVAEQLMAIALCELAAMNDACAPRPWTAAFLRLAGPVPEIEGLFADLCQMDARDVLRSCLAGTVTLLDGASEDEELLFLVARERSGDRSDVVEHYASLIAKGELAVEYGAWLSGQLAPRVANDRHA
ncbi:MAG TPA: hypothetical protein VK934_02140, partial [Fimbriimonas sp.]|nr:hypothetical protein [Fimbriimonas sp.]